MRCGIPNPYILDIAMYKMHVSLCSYCTVRILVSKTLTGTYEVLEIDKYTDCTIRTQRHMHFIHSYIKNVNVWDPTARFKHC